MKIEKKHKLRAKRIRQIIANQNPEVLYAMSDFMDLEGQSDEGMFSQNVYDAAELFDVYSTDGTNQHHRLDMGMSLPSIEVKFTFSLIDNDFFEIHDVQCMGYKS